MFRPQSLYKGFQSRKGIFYSFLSFFSDSNLDLFFCVNGPVALQSAHDWAVPSYAATYGSDYAPCLSDLTGYTAQQSRLLYGNEKHNVQTLVLHTPLLVVMALF